MAAAQTTSAQAVVRNISDTARWAAVFRARETGRPDALFRDPFAERLAGKMGVEIANTLPEGNSHAWAWVARTYLFDEFIAQELAQGTDMVVNLAAGPGRAPLPHGAAGFVAMDRSRFAGNSCLQGRNSCE